MYPETCHRSRCAALHPVDHKRDFDFTLAAPERAGDAALRRIGAGAVQLRINDRVDVALAAQADGVRLGRHCLPAVVRERFGGKLLVGVPTHCAAEVVPAADFVTLRHPDAYRESGAAESIELSIESAGCGQAKIESR